MNIVKTLIMVVMIVFFFHESFVFHVQVWLFVDWFFILFSSSFYFIFQRNANSNRKSVRVTKT